MIRSKIARLRRSIIPANDYYYLLTDGLNHCLRLIDSIVITHLNQEGFGFDYPHCGSIGYLISLYSPLHASSLPQLSTTEQTCLAIKQEVRLLFLNSFFCC